MGPIGVNVGHTVGTTAHESEEVSVKRNLFSETEKEKKKK